MLTGSFVRSRCAVDRAPAVRGSVAPGLLLYYCECACFTYISKQNCVTDRFRLWCLGPQEDLHLARYFPGCRGCLSGTVRMGRLVTIVMYGHECLLIVGEDLVRELIRCQYCPMRTRGTYASVTGISYVHDYLKLGLVIKR